MSYPSQYPGLLGYSHSHVYTHTQCSNNPFKLFLWKMRAMFWSHWLWLLLAVHAQVTFVERIICVIQASYWNCVPLRPLVLAVFLSVLMKQQRWAISVHLMYLNLQLLTSNLFLLLSKIGRKGHVLQQSPHSTWCALNTIIFISTAVQFFSLMTTNIMGIFYILQATK